MRASQIAHWEQARGKKSMSRTIQALAFKRATAVSLKDLFKFGSDSRPAQRLRNAQFLHNELPIRYIHTYLTLGSAVKHRQ